MCSAHSALTLNLGGMWFASLNRFQKIIIQVFVANYASTIFVVTNTNMIIYSNSESILRRESKDFRHTGQTTAWTRQEWKILSGEDTLISARHQNWQKRYTTVSLTTILTISPGLRAYNFPTNQLIYI